jgi:hypothetical protein
MRYSKALWFALAGVAIAASLISFWHFSSGTLLSDFRAFYCAGGLSMHGLDPYRQEPLYTCEARIVSPILWHAAGHVTNPAPLPPYALAIFVPLSLMAYGVAAALWTLVIVASWLTVVVALRIMTGYSWSVLAAAVVFAAAMSLSLGQIAPIAIALLCGAAVALLEKRPEWAGVLAALAMCEPHVVLPSCIALFVAVRRSRLPLLLMGCALIGISFSFGAHRNFEYAFYALPSHALSDVADVGQYSLTVLLHVVGLSDAAASRSGSLWYALAAIAGVATAWAAAKKLAFPPLLVTVPIAFAVFGGPYVHWQQVAGALPAAMLLASRQQRPSRVIVAAIVGLSIPWLYVVGWGFLIPGAIAVIGIISWELLGLKLGAATTVVAVAFTVLVLLNHAVPHASAIPAFAIVADPNAWADQSWGAYVRSRIPVGAGLFFWLHVPTWGALGVVIAAALREAWRPVNEFPMRPRPVLVLARPAARLVSGGE